MGRKAIRNLNLLWNAARNLSQSLKLSLNFQIVPGMKWGKQRGMANSIFYSERE
jgi:hypothetical protein